MGDLREKLWSLEPRHRHSSSKCSGDHIFMTLAIFIGAMTTREERDVNVAPFKLEER